MTTRPVHFLLAAALAAALLPTALPAAPAAAVEVADSYRDIDYPELPEFDIPSPKTFTLKNGMRVFLIRDTELPLIDVTARIRTGSNYDPPDKTGLGDLVGQVMREGGTSSMTGDEIDDFLAARAASVETGMGGDVGFASMDCLKEDFEEVLAVFADVLRKPVFAEDKIEVAKGQAKAGIARRNDNIGGIAEREFSRLIYGPDSALGRMVEYSTLASIERQDLIDWHEDHYHPNNVYLGVSGDFDPGTIRKTLEKAFGDWKKGPDFSEPEPAIAETITPGAYFVEKGDVTQAYVRLGHRGIRIDNPDYFAAQVLNEVFGGGLSARLFSRVRSDKGLAYSVGGGIGASFTRPGVFRVALSTKSGTMAEAVDALKVEMRNIIDDPPSKAELERAKESILNSFVFNYASPQQVLAQQLTYAYYGLPSDFLETYRDSIEKVTAKDVARVAKQYIHPDETVLLVVGKSEDFDRPVSTFGEVKQIDITIPEPPDDAPEVEMSADNLRRGSELMSKAAGTLHGASSEAIRSLRTESEIELKLGPQAMSAVQSRAVVLPDKFRQTLRLPMGEQTTVINGSEGFAAMAGQRQPLPEDRVDDALEGLRRELVLLLGNAGHPELQAVAGQADSVGGTSCQVVAVTFKDAETRLCVADDGTVLRQSYRGNHPMQGPGTMQVVFSDWRDVDGRTLPFVREVSFEGQPFVTERFESVEINPHIDESTFALE